MAHYGLSSRKRPPRLDTFGGGCRTLSKMTPADDRSQAGKKGSFQRGEKYGGARRNTDKYSLAISWTTTCVFLCYNPDQNE